MVPAFLTENFPEISIQYLLTGISQHTAELLIHIDKPVLIIHDENSLIRILHYGTEAIFALQKRILRPFLFGGITGNDHGVGYLSLFITVRIVGNIEVAHPEGLKFEPLLIIYLLTGETSVQVVLNVLAKHVLTPDIGYHLACNNLSRKIETQTVRIVCHFTDIVAVNKGDHIA